MKALVVFIFSMTVSMAALAQNSYYGGLQLELKPSVAFQNDWKLSTKLSARHILFKGSETQPLYGVSIFNRAELELVMTKKVRKNLTLGAGYVIRDEEGYMMHRFIQQLSFSSDARNLSIGHRFRLDQSFYEDEGNAYRFRYRINFEKPLKKANGENKKSYLFVSNEYLPMLQDKKVEVETRLIPGIGFKLNDKNKLELGIDYRMERLFMANHKQRFLLNIAWLPSF